jgi:hypothetical protein
MAMSNITFPPLGLFLLFQPRKAAFTKYRGFPVPEFQNFIKTPRSPLSKRVAPFQAAKAGEVVISADPFACVLDCWRIEIGVGNEVPGCSRRLTEPQQNAPMAYSCGQAIATRPKRPSKSAVLVNCRPLTVDRVTGRGFRSSDPARFLLFPLDAVDHESRPSEAINTSQRE